MFQVGVDVSVGLVVLLFALYLVLLFRWDLVRRPSCYLIGVGGFVIFFASGFFGTGASWNLVVTRICQTLGTLIAFGAVMIACFRAKLPVNIPGAEMPEEKEEKPQDEA